MSRAAISAHLRQIGIGYGSPTLQECVINSIQKHSALKDLMTDLDVLLFDAHDTKIAESLLKRRVNSLTLFEVSQPFSKKMKTFASSASKSGAGGAPKGVAAYRSSLHDLLSREECSTFVKLLEEKRGIEKKPHIIRKREDSNAADQSPSGARGPVIVSTLPALSQQQALIKTLREHLIEHVCFATRNVDTIFQFGDTRLITFLPVGLFGQVICSAPNYANRLEFMTRVQKHSSAVLNALFKLDVLNDGNGFSSADFAPGILAKEETESRAKKFLEAGFPSDLTYGLSFTPRRSIQLGDVAISTHSAVKEEKNALLKFVFWMEETGKLKKKQKLKDVLRDWFPGEKPKTECEVGSLTAKDFVVLFAVAMRNIQAEKSSSAFYESYKKFEAIFLPEKKEEEYFD